MSPKLPLPTLFCFKVVSAARFSKLHAKSLSLQGSEFSQDHFFANRWCGKCQVKRLCGIEMKLYTVILVFSWLRNSIRI